MSQNQMWKLEKSGSGSGTAAIGAGKSSSSPTSTFDFDSLIGLKFNKSHTNQVPDSVLSRSRV